MKEKTNKTLSFIKRNAIYFILALCVLAIGVSITLALLHETSLNSGSITDKPVVDTPVEDEPNEDDKPTVEPENPTPSEPVITQVTFIIPVSNTTRIDDYCETMTFNSTLSRYSAHLAVDFYAAEGTNVLAVYKGVVESVENSPLTGVTVTIDHGDGLKTIYNSLGETDMVTVGQTVEQGDVIGTVSVSNKQEYKEGAHLHFQVKEDGKIIDPEKYLTFDEK